jgi:hypothetical protein
MTRFAYNLERHRGHMDEERKSSVVGESLIQLPKPVSHHHL